MKVTARLSTLTALLTLSQASATDLAPRVTVSGDLPKNGALGIRDLEALGATTFEWSDHGEKHQVRGVLLDKVLAAFGYSPGAYGKQVAGNQKRAGWRKVVVAIGSDGYEVAFSCAEISQEIGATRALLSWSMDGVPLRAGSGPLRLAVPTDREPARSVRNLERLVVVDVSQPLTRPTH